MGAQADDTKYMRHALRLAERALGSVAPNPAVGCIILSSGGRIAGRGWTQAGGRPHAETVALAQAGSAARGGTAYVTLEPCAHHGMTPPCADALITSGVSRVVGATIDPDPRVAGSGFARLQSAGIEVTRSVLEMEARALNTGFFKRVTEGRPLVALKIAQSADGYVADAAGHSKWITGERARAHGHLLRAHYDAILVGIGTVLADDPMLNCRLRGLERRSPVRVVLDSKLRIPIESQLVRTARDHPTIVVTTRADQGGVLSARGVEIVAVPADEDGRPDLIAMLETLGNRGLTRVLVEGGPSIHAAMLQRKLVDRIHLYRAPLLIGEGGIPAFRAFAPRRLDEAPRLKLIEHISLGPDVLESFALTV